MENVNTPSVDITILSWDRIDDTLDAIDSALSQQGIDLKVIVVDQGSKLTGWQNCVSIVLKILEFN
ncbi:glycosyltransferase family 2 protein [Vibrio sp. SCSIO 43132]|uniref:glycosyltransferase family 2 protein n=1 Tax=Vibrio sp. SCSIO 43132 TaxID=2779363 RepID=UPI001CA9CD64|nr:hypothetical protein [Vibrio sp. SCSIO 43132]